MPFDPVRWKVPDKICPIYGFDEAIYQAEFDVEDSFGYAVSLPIENLAKLADQIWGELGFPEPLQIGLYETFTSFAYADWIEGKPCIGYCLQSRSLRTRRFLLHEIAHLLAPDDLVPCHSKPWQSIYLGLCRAYDLPHFADRLEKVLEERRLNRTPDLTTCVRSDRF